MDRQTVVNMHVQTDIWTDRQTYGRAYGHMDRQTVIWTVRRTYGKAARHIDGNMDGQTNKWTFMYYLDLYFPSNQGVQKKNSSRASYNNAES